MENSKMKSEAVEVTGLDAMLASEAEIVPSSGFLSAVMERVKEEASAPAPIPFPWKRTLPGFALVAAVFGWMGVELVRAGATAMTQSSGVMVQIPPGLVQPIEQAGWVGLGLAVSLASWLLTRRLAGRSELL
jgi:hypothetical protein